MQQVSVLTCMKGSNVLPIAKFNVHNTQSISFELFSTSKQYLTCTRYKPVIKKMKDNLKNVFCQVISCMWSQGERGPAGPPGIQGETGFGLPGPKVKVMDDLKLYSCTQWLTSCISVGFYLVKFSFCVNLQGDMGFQGRPGPPGPPGVGEPGSSVS